MTEVDPRVQAHLDCRRSGGRPVRPRSVSARVASPSRCGGAQPGAGEARGRHDVARQPPPRARVGSGIRARETARRRDCVRAWRAGPRRTAAPPPGAAEHRRAARRGALGARAVALRPDPRRGLRVRGARLHRRPDRRGTRRARRRGSCRVRGPRVRRRSSQTRGSSRSSTLRSTRSSWFRRSSTSARTTSCTASRASRTARDGRRPYASYGASCALEAPCS